MAKIKKATIDFETRSPVDLKVHGSWVYSKDPRTEVMVLRYKLPGEEEVKIWHMAHPDFFITESPPPQDLFDHIENGGLVEAHNAFFEFVIWTNIMAARHGWPKIPRPQWRCSAAKASACSLPRDLEGAAKAMGLPIEKDMEGRKLMLKMSKPRKLRKAEMEAWTKETGWEGRAPAYKSEDYPVVYHETEEDIYRLWDYCGTDVLTEEALSDALPELMPQELAVWQMDQEMNALGAKFDLELARAALKMASEWKKILNKELETITGISAGTKRAAIKEWLLENEELELPDTTADTLEWFIEHEDISGRARRICEIMMEVNKTSTRKYTTMIKKADADDWRIRDLLMYHGAGTGRWAGKGVQVQNFPGRDLIVKDFDEAAEYIKSGDIEWCRLMYGDIMKLLSHALRGAVIAEEGKDFMVADYSAIEARCVLWESASTAALDIFRQGGDIYCDMATGIYGFTVNKKDHPNERQFGKQAILGLGYGMGFVTFLLTCRKYKIYFSRADVLRIMGPERLGKYEAWVKDYLCLTTLPANATPEDVKKYRNKARQAAQVRRRLLEARENANDIVHELALMKYTVDVYRSRYPEVKQMWKDQENAAIQAVEGWEILVAQQKAIDDPEPGHEYIKWRDGITGPRVEAGVVTWFVEGGFLKCELPSKRCIHYRDPEIKMVKTSWGESRRGLRYMSVDGVTRKWVRTATYGGKLVENITQAIARDIMANAMLLAKEGGIYSTVMSVHDELVCEVNENEGDLKDFEDLMSNIPAWAAGCPITAEAERFKRYRK